MALNSAILAIFGPPPDSIDVADSRVGENNAAVIALLCLAAVAVILRFVARISLRNPLMADDWAILIALLLVGATAGLSISGGAAGAGKHVWGNTLDSLTMIFKVLYAYTFVYAAACASTKISILMFYRRVFTPLDPALKIAICFGFFLTLSYPLTIWVTMANCCRPVSYFWNKFSGAEGKCINVNQFFLALGIINMLNDFIVLLIPFPRIVTLQMSIRKKVAICGIMAVGLFACVASIVRIHYLSLFTHAIDVTWFMGPVFIWSTIEPCVAIVCACLPHLAPLARQVHESVFTSLGSRGKSNSASVSRPWKGGSIYRGQWRGAEDDEIGLTNDVTVGGRIGRIGRLGNVRDRDGGGRMDQEIFVQSSFVQSSFVQSENKP